MVRTTAARTTITNKPFIIIIDISIIIIIINSSSSSIVEAPPFYVVNCATLRECRTIQYYSLYARRIKLRTSFESNQR